MPVPSALKPKVARMLRARLGDQTRSRFTHSRYAAIASVLVFTGCRASECRQLLSTDLTRNPDGSLVINFRSLKRGRNRAVPIVSRQASFLLACWFLGVKSYVDNPERSFLLFPSSPAASTPVCYRTVWRASRFWLKVRPHALRHMFGSTIFRLSKNIRLTQQLLGHRSLSATQIYTHVDPQDVAASIASYSELFGKSLDPRPAKSTITQKRTANRTPAGDRVCQSRPRAKIIRTATQRMPSRVWRQPANGPGRPATPSTRTVRVPKVSRPRPRIDSL